MDCGIFTARFSPVATLLVLYLTTELLVWAKKITTTPILELCGNDTAINAHNHTNSYNHRLENTGRQRYSILQPGDRNYTDSRCALFRESLQNSESVRQLTWYLKLNDLLSDQLLYWAIDAHLTHAQTHRRTDVHPHRRTPVQTYRRTDVQRGDEH